MIKIGKIKIGLDQKPFIIAEMSGNHNQSLDKALKIVESVAESGADALKLQTYTADTLTLEVEKGDFFGWPFFYLGENLQPNLEKNNFYFKNVEQTKNKSIKKPDVLFKSHSGPIDMIFYDKKQFSEEFQGNAFVALHGSWNSSKPSGYMVVRIPFKNNKPLKHYESFVTGFWVSNSKSANVCGRPAGLGITKKGSLLISDDINGIIYSVRYIK